jgi:ABC-2 type transport system ATP-binding protein
MGETKAIIFSTHILEEVEAACSRAIIIDRGQIVANGTPEELKRRSEHAGAVTLRLADGNISNVRQKLEQIPGLANCVVVSDTPVAVRAYAKKDGQELARAIGEIAATERWKIAELHTEEGRLDEVFRSITLPDTKREERK